MPYTIVDLEELLDKIKDATNLTQEELERQAGYSAGYISAVKSKSGNIPPKLIRNLKKVFAKDLEKVLVHPDSLKILVENSLHIRAQSEVYGALVIELLAAQRNQSPVLVAQGVANQLDLRLSKLRDELYKESS